MIALESDEAVSSFAESHERLGSVPLDRIRMVPAPGSATEADLIRVNARGRGLFELVEGILVEKAMGAKESLLASFIIELMGSFSRQHDLGIVLGEAGMFQLGVGLVRLPDLSFIPWGRIPNEDFPDHPISKIIPALAVEVLSKGNTVAEIERKIEEYFAAGIEVVWTVDNRKKTARNYDCATSYKPVPEAGALEADRVLPGFKLPLKQLFVAGRRKKD